MKVAIEGCCHGELDKIYETLDYLEKANGVKVDILLICGDFQSVRNTSDLQCMAVPPKYRLMNTFYKYYSGEKTAPVLTLFIGGNHEASNYLQELPYGGWVAPNIYYMGYANVVQFGGVRIGGLSGIYKPRDYDRGHFERPPYSEDTKRSAYHIRNVDVFRLKQISRPIEIMLSHDWPRGIYHHGNKERLLRAKRHFRDEVENNSLGSLPAEELLHHIKPAYWFSAHLHVKFAAAVQHQMEDGTSKTTRFLSLDKCLPKRHFLQVIDVPHDTTKGLTLELDPEWLVILKSTNHLFNIRANKQFMPGLGCSERWDFRVTDAEISTIKADFDDNLAIPENFVQTVPPYTTGGKNTNTPPVLNTNPQTTLICTMLDLTDPNAEYLGRDSSFKLDNSSLSMSGSFADDGIDSDNDEEQSANSSINTTFNSSINTTMNSSFNPEEIAIDDDDDDLVTGEISDSDMPATTTTSSTDEEKDCFPLRGDSSGEKTSEDTKIDKKDDVISSTHAKFTAEQINTEKANAEKANAEKTNAEKANAGKVNAGKVNAEKANAGNANAENANAGNANAGKVNIEQFCPVIAVTDISRPNMDSIAIVSATKIHDSEDNVDFVDSAEITDILADQHKSENCEQFQPRDDSPNFDAELKDILNAQNQRQTSNISDQKTGVSISQVCHSESSLDKTGNLPDKTGNLPDKTGNLPDKTGKSNMDQISTSFTTLSGKRGEAIKTSKDSVASKILASKTVDSRITPSLEADLTDGPNSKVASSKMSDFEVDSKAKLNLMPALETQPITGDGCVSGNVSPKRDLEGKDKNVPRVKKMKRRNMCVYSSEDNTEGEN